MKSKTLKILMLFITAFFIFIGNKKVFAESIHYNQLSGARGNLTVRIPGIGDYPVYVPENGNKNIALHYITNDAGDKAFCVEPEVLLRYTGNGGYTATELGAGVKINKRKVVLTPEQDEYLRATIYWGWDMAKEQNGKQFEYIQALVWETLGYPVLSMSGDLNLAEYNEIKAFINQQYKSHAPSWNKQHITVKAGESITLQDYKHIAHYLDFEPLTQSGWHVEKIYENKEGGAIKLTPSPEAKTGIFKLNPKGLPANYEATNLLYKNPVTQDVIVIKDPNFITGMLELSVQKEATLKLVKKDTEGHYVPNVTFEVSYYEDFSGTKWTYKTGEDGTVTIPKWKGSTVYVREIDVPDHLFISDEVKKVDFRYDRVNEVEFINPIRYELKLTKKDTAGNYVPGVTFEVCYYEDFSGTKYTYTTEKDGTVTIPNWARSNIQI